MSFAVTIQIDPEMMKAFNKMTVVFSPHKAASADAEQTKSDHVVTYGAPAPESEPDDISAKQVEEKPISPAAEPENKASVVVIKPEEIRAVAATKDREKVKNLLAEHEYKSISGIPEEARAAFLAKLKEC